MNIQITERIYTKELLRSNPDKIYVFGDNLEKFGKGGQAIIRNEPNAFGIPTKRYPSKDNWAYFSDKMDERQVVLESLRNLYKIAASDKIIVFPSGGIGTGLARMESKSPLLWREMCEILEKHFGFINQRAY